MADCHIGYIPRRYFYRFSPKAFDLLFLCVVTDYRISNNKHECMRSKHNYGLLLCEVIHNNPKYNSYNPLENEPCEVSSVESNTHPIDRLVREGQSKCNRTVGSMSGSTNTAGTVG